MIGWGEILIIGAVGVVVFGGAMLPKIAKSLGKSMKEFKDAIEDKDKDKDEQQKT